MLLLSRDVASKAGKPRNTSSSIYHMHVLSMIEKKDVEKIRKLVFVLDFVNVQNSQVTADHA